jgi:hypothetical protein
MIGDIFAVPEIALIGGVLAMLVGFARRKTRTGRYASTCGLIVVSIVILISISSGLRLFRR